MHSPQHHHEKAPPGSGKWVVGAGVQDYDGKWWEREYQLSAADRDRALEAGCEKAREADRYAQAVCPYDATMRGTGPATA